MKGNEYDASISRYVGNLGVFRSCSFDMGLLLKFVLHLLCLGAIAFAIPVSLLEDIKDAQLQSPLRANKVKRAQEVLMFGNQQNRAVNTYGNPKQEKRDVGDNNLADEVPTLPNILPQMEEQSYDTNQLGAGEKYEKSYPYISREPNYGMLLRNAALKESLHNEPVLGYGDLSLYNMMDARRKRDAHKEGTSLPKTSYRSKRDYDPYDLSPEEVVSLMRLLETQRRQNGRYHDQRNNWSGYGSEAEDFGLPERHEENDIASDSNYSHNGVWMDGPISMNQSPHDADFWPRKLKRFMVSKRRSEGEPLSQLNSPYDFSEGIPLQRRFIL